MNNFVWWVGVVEDRNDPERLGRCKVRIFGYHTEDVNLLPTEDLPWAIPIQPITSASISGIGTTPVGIVPGTWVTGWFLDGEDAQKPVILGTIPGKTPKREEAQKKIRQDATKSNVLKDGSGNPIYENTGNLIFKSQVVTELRQSLPPLMPTDVDKLFLTLSNKLSGGDVGKIGTNGELGKYQFSVLNLIDLGYVKRPGKGAIDKTILDKTNLWTGLDGITSKDKFLSSTLIQEKAMLNLTKSNYDLLEYLSKIEEDDDADYVAGILASAHLFGPTGADDLERKDFYGRKAKEFFALGAAAVGGERTNVDLKYKEAENYLPESSNSDGSSVTNEDLAKVRGFSDPEKKYPKYEYEGLSDINMLAVGNRNHLSFKIKEAQRTDDVQIARSSSMWSEPEPAYSATYPHNQVIETEAGHVIELDSTPNAERIHVFHKKGTYIEIDVNGSMVRKVIGDNYEILERNNFVYVKGANNITVDGRTNIYVKDDASIEVDGDVSVTGHRDAVVQAAKSLALSAKNVIISGKESVNIVSDGAINLQSKEMNLNAKGSLNAQAGLTVSLKASASLLMDALLVKTQMGANFVSDLPIPTYTPPEVKNPTRSSVPVLERKASYDESFLLDAGEPEAEEFSNYRNAKGEISNNVVLDLTKVSSPKTNGSNDYKRYSCEICEKFGNNFPRSFRLSKNYTLGNLLIGRFAPPKVAAQRGLQAKEIVCNLMQLAENCLEPILAKYPDATLTAGLREDGATLDGRDISAGDHPLGAAADLRFTSATLDDYVDIANWCVKNIPFRQLLLEYETYEKSTRIRTVWIHVAILLDKNGRIIQSRNPPVMTMINHKKLCDGIITLT
jgi:hypothetical protein